MEPEEAAGNRGGELGCQGTGGEMPQPELMGCVPHGLRGWESMDLGLSGGSAPQGLC
jgi:hypothetical protein